MFTQVGDDQVETAEEPRETGAELQAEIEVPSGKP